MRKSRVFIGTLSIILLLGIFFNWKRISDGMFRVGSSVIASRARSAESFWFGHVDIDSLYGIKGYKYCVFMKSPGDMDALAVYKDSLLVITAGDWNGKVSGQGYDAVTLPGSAFFYLLEEDEKGMVCRIDSTTQSVPCRYKMRKIRKW